jgi:hypothetical protein
MLYVLFVLASFCFLHIYFRAAWDLVVLCASFPLCLSGWLLLFRECFNVSPLEYASGVVDVHTCLGVELLRWGYTVFTQAPAHHHTHTPTQPHFPAFAHTCMYPDARGQRSTPCSIVSGQVIRSDESRDMCSQCGPLQHHALLLPPSASLSPCFRSPSPSPLC